MNDNFKDLSNNILDERESSDGLKDGIRFYEDDLKKVQELGRAVFSQVNDPRLITYNRILERPKVNLISDIIKSLLFTICVVYIYRELMIYFNNSLYLSIGITLSLMCIFIIIRLKAIELELIRIYQRYAPESIRKRCRFEPSCSQYMILSIEKYGRFKGVCKGVKRLTRCNSKDGGFDYP